MEPGNWPWSQIARAVMGYGGLGEFFLQDKFCKLHSCAITSCITPHAIKILKSSQAPSKPFNSTLKHCLV